MRKSTGKIFVIQFIKSFVFIIIFISIILVIYFAIMNFYGTDETDVIMTILPAKEQTQIHTASIDDISKQLIFCVDDETGDIEKIVLEIFNCGAHRMAYITIPIKTQFTLSDSLYRELVLKKPSLPQSLKLSAVTGYFTKESVYEYGVLMIEDMLDMSISYYSAVPQSIYEKVFKTGDLPQNSVSQPDSHRLTGEVFSEGFLEFLHTITTETDLGNHIKKIYDGIESNLSLEGKLNYLESYLKVAGDNISFEIIAGVDSNSGYTVDKPMAIRQIGAYIYE